jgi:transcription initiation factor TFIID subunit 15
MVSKLRGDHATVLVRNSRKSFAASIRSKCHFTVMGKIPSTSNMVSSIIISPKPAENIAANKDFTISIQTSGLTAGSFTNAAATYYAAPQELASNGQIIGHTHVTVQDMGNSLTPSAALDPNAFVFFKGINDAGNGRGLLSATVTGGLPAGNYRVCTMSSSSNHQPVLMPVAQRGAQDDCQKFTVGGNAATGSGSNSGSGSSNRAGGSAASGKVVTTSTKATATTAQSNRVAVSSAPSSSRSSADTLGGITPPAVSNTGDSFRPFSVNGATFANQAAAQQRACAIQNNACSDAVNNGSATGFTVADCGAQEKACNGS